MDNDPNTQSYNKFLYLGNQIDNSNKEYYQKLFKNRKDRYRKWRDMSVFAMVGVYLISVVDAYVDASLSEFDISRDLSMKVSPAVIKERANGLEGNGAQVIHACPLSDKRRAPNQRGQQQQQGSACFFHVFILPRFYAFHNPAKMGK